MPTVSVAVPYLSPSDSETYARMAVEGWCTSRQPLLPLNIYQRARLGHPTSLTFMGPTDSIVHSAVITYMGRTTVCTCVCVKRTKRNLTHRCTLSMLLHGIYRQLQQIWTFCTVKNVSVSPKILLLFLFSPQIYMLCTLYQIQVTIKNIFTCVLFCCREELVQNNT